MAQQELRPATNKSSVNSEKEEEALPIDEIGKGKMIDSYMNNSSAIATAERASNYSLSLVPKGKSLAVQKYSKNSKIARLDLKEVCILLSEFHAKTTKTQSKKQRQGELLAVGDIVDTKIIEHIGQLFKRPREADSCRDYWYVRCRTFGHELEEGRFAGR